MPATNKPSPSNLLPVLAVLCAVLLWSSSFVAMKVSLRALTPEALVWVRLSVATLLLVPVTMAGVRRAYRPGDWKGLGLMALLQPCLYFAFEANALVHTSASQAGMISSLVPLLVALGAGWLLGERITARTYAGLALSCAGVVWLTLAGQPGPQGPNPVLGNLLELAAMVSVAGYMIAVRRLSQHYSTWGLTGVQALAGAIFFLPGGAELLAAVNVSSEHLAPALLAAAYLGAFVTIGGFGFYNWSLGRMAASRASSFINLVPVCTALMGWAYLGESFTPSQLLACCVVMIGVLWSQGMGAPRQLGRRAEPDVTRA